MKRVGVRTHKSISPRPTHRRGAMERYEELKTLGRGAFGVAILVRRRTDDKVTHLTPHTIRNPLILKP